MSSTEEMRNASDAIYGQCSNKQVREVMATPAVDG